MRAGAPAPARPRACAPAPTRARMRAQARLRGRASARAPKRTRAGARTRTRLFARTRASCRLHGWPRGPPLLSQEGGYPQTYNRPWVSKLIVTTGPSTGPTSSTSSHIVTDLQFHVLPISVGPVERPVRNYVEVVTIVGGRHHMSEVTPQGRYGVGGTPRWGGAIPTPIDAPPPSGSPSRRHGVTTPPRWGGHVVT